MQINTRSKQKIKLTATELRQLKTAQQILDDLSGACEMVGMDQEADGSMKASRLIEDVTASLNAQKLGMEVQ